MMMIKATFAGEEFLGEPEFYAAPGGVVKREKRSLRRRDKTKNYL